MDALLAGYASGALPPALHALVGAHLDLTHTNRSYVRSLEDALAGTLLSDPAKPVANRNDRLSAIFGIEEPVAVPRSAQLGNSGDPKSLVHFLGMPIDEVVCHTVLPGVQEHRIELDDGMRAILYRIRGGKAMPQHTHDGAEVTLVIRGAFADKSGRFGPGDVAITDEDVDHIPVAEAGQECVCFAVIDAPVRLTGRFGRWFNRFVKH